MYAPRGVETVHEWTSPVTRGVKCKSRMKYLKSVLNIKFEYAYDLLSFVTFEHVLRSIFRFLCPGSI